MNHIHPTNAKPVAPRVQRFSLNQKGRDFVIGDVHGAFDLVLEGMKKVSFNPSEDRLFSVGDLVDRGPESARCLKFLRQSFTAAVSGNHEVNLLEIYKNGEPPPEVLQFFASHFKMGWWLEAPADVRSGILEAFSELPVVIEIETRRGLVGLVHGDIPKGMAWGAFVAAVEKGDPEVLEVALEGRDRIKKRDLSGVAGVGRVYVGHSVQHGGPGRYGNIYAVDTGAVFNHIAGKEDCGLTLANIAFQTGLLVDQANRGPAPVMVFDNDPALDSRPFSPISS